MEFLPTKRSPEYIICRIGDTLLDGLEYAAVRALYVSSLANNTVRSRAESLNATADPNSSLGKEGDWPPVLPRWQASGPEERMTTATHCRTSHDTAHISPAPTSPVARTAAAMDSLLQSSLICTSLPGTVVGTKDFEEPRDRLS